MGKDFPRDFETVEEYRARVARDSVFDEPVTCETDIGKVLEQFTPEQPVSDEIVNGHRVRVYANGTRITSGLGEPFAPEGNDGVRPGSDAARAAFKAGREEEYIDRMKARYGGEW
jgi:hypothetical protein